MDERNQVFPEVQEPQTQHHTLFQAVIEERQHEEIDWIEGDSDFNPYEDEDWYEWEKSLIEISGNIFGWYINRKRNIMSNIHLYRNGRMKMKFVIQRVTEAEVEVNENCVGKIGKGFLVLIGIAQNDSIEIADKMIEKLIKLRVFSDENGKMNLALKDVCGELLLVSQFTLYANCRRGNRPDFIKAAKAEQANELYEYIVSKCKENELIVQTGVFGADMKVELVNDGPVTIILESDEIVEDK